MEYRLLNISLTGNVYKIPVDYDAIGKSDILNIHKYLTIKNNIKNIQAYQKSDCWIIMF